MFAMFARNCSPSLAEVWVYSSISFPHWNTYDIIRDKDGRGVKAEIRKPFMFYEYPQ